MKKFILFLFLLIYSPLFSQDYESYEILDRDSMSEILNYEGDKSLIKKVLIRGEIQGTDYSEGSEWREFRVLDTTFPNIEAVEIWTDQDIPDASEFYHEGIEFVFLISLFSNVDDMDGWFGWGGTSFWLKHFSAPNTKYIGLWAFNNCQFLESVNIPNAEIIGDFAFMFCISLTSATNFFKVKEIKLSAFDLCNWLKEIDFPSVEIIGDFAFRGNNNLEKINLPLVKMLGYSVFKINHPPLNDYLKSVSFGTGFTEPTEIKFGQSVFTNNATNNSELILGEYALPLWNLDDNVWQDSRGDGYGTPYYWKNITIMPVGIEDDLEENNIFYIANNTYYIKDILELNLFDIFGRKIMTFSNKKIIDLNDLYLQTGVYFLTYTKNNKQLTKKIIYY